MTIKPYFLFATILVGMTAQSQAGMGNPLIRWYSCRLWQDCGTIPFTTSKPVFSRTSPGAPARLWGSNPAQGPGLVTSTSTESQTTLGGQAGAGVDFILTSWLAFELDGGYTVMQDFSQPFGSRDNFNGRAASFGVSFFWGR